MPTQPPINGLPLWAQLTISFVIGLATLAVALKGYLIKDKPALSDQPTSAAILAATFADGFAIRSLSDACTRLEASVVALTRTIDESTHYERNNVEINREVCARLRELREVQERLVEIAERSLK